MSDALSPMDTTPPSPTAALPTTRDSSSDGSQKEKKKPEAAVLSEAELIEKGRKKIQVHKWLIASFIFTCK